LLSDLVDHNVEYFAVGFVTVTLSEAHVDILEVVRADGQKVVILVGECVTREALRVEGGDEGGRVVSIGEALVGQDALSKANVVRDALDHVLIECLVQDFH